MNVHRAVERYETDFPQQTLVHMRPEVEGVDRQSKLLSIRPTIFRARKRPNYEWTSCATNTRR